MVYASVDEKQEESEDLDADYVVDEKARTATLTARGIQRAERAFGLENLADIENATLSHHINQALKAHGIMKRDIDYIVKDGEIIIVDEFTGRLMLGRRYSEGLHQAIEAKEHVDVQKENKTLATITFQNYFRLYDKLSGMTGTAVTEAEEFGAIYKLDIIEIPTNKPVIRIDHPDVVYKNDAGKNRAIIQQIVDCHEKGQPVLVGTVSIEKSEYLSKLLKMRGIPHTVLNAKYHEKEAEIVAQAGKLGAVTIATNMAGRGTDIMLGGNAEFLARQDLRKAGFADEVIAEATGYAETKDEDILAARALYARKLQEHKDEIRAEAEQVRAAGGLFILGTERHESRRIDNQLRGRAGRQGDPGESRFYLALTDDIMRLFGSERIMGMMETLKMDEDTPIDAKILSNSIEQAQKTVESRNFQTRKNVLEYDDVMNQQREIIYGERRKVLDGEDLQEQILGMIREFVKGTVLSGLNGAPVESQEQLDEVLKPFEKLFLPRAPPAEDFGGHSGGSDKLIEAGHRPGRAGLRRPGGGLRPRPQRRAADAGAGAGHHAAGGGRILDGPHRRHDRAQAGHRPAGLRRHQAHRRLQAGGLRHVRGHGRRHPGGDGAPPLHRAGPPGAAHRAQGRGQERRRQRGRRAGEEKAGEEGPQARPQRPLPLRQDEGRRQPPAQIQGVLREKRISIFGKSAAGSQVFERCLLNRTKRT